MANDRQISQLVLQVDANIAVAQRSLQDLARTVEESMRRSNKALGDNDNAITRTLSSHHAMGLAFNNARIAQTELTAAFTRSIDAYGAGASPLRILTTEMGRLTEAASFLGGGAGNGVLGAIVRFIGGPWGIAMLLAGSIIAKVVTSHKEASDSVEALVAKMRKQAEEAANSKIADAEWAATIDGLIDRNLKLIDTLQKRLKAEEDLDQQTLRQAQHDAATAAAELQAAKTRLANLQAQQAALSAANATGGAGTRAGSLAPVGQSNILASQIAQAQQDVATAQKAVDAAQGAIAKNTIAVGEAIGKAMADSKAAVDLWAKDYVEALHVIEGRTPDATAQIAGAFEGLKKALDDAAAANVPFKSAGNQANALASELLHGKISVVQYAEAMAKLAASLEAAAAAAKEAKKGTGEFGKQIGFADAEAIARSAGLTVTSGYRSVARQAQLYNDPNVNKPGNPVAPPGASAHNGLNGRWALDIAFAPGLTAESLKKLYGSQGVTLSAVYKESGHFHIEGSTSQATAAQKAADRAAQKQQTDADQFAKESAQLDAEILAAKKQLMGGFDTQAKLADKEIDAEKKAQLEAIQKQVDAHQITAAQGKILSAQVEELASAKKAVVDQRAYVQQLEQTLKATEQSLGFQLDDLKFADDMATTQADHRRIQLQILDIQYQQKKAELDYQLMLIKRNQDFANSPALQQQAALVQGQIDRLPTEKAEDQARVVRGTLDPLQQWAQQVPHDAATIKEALQSIEVQGIDNLASSITDVITGTKSLGEAFKGVAQSIISDIIQMTIKMLIFKAISSFLGGAGGGSGGFTGDFTGNLFGVPSFGGARASGGTVDPSKFYLVGENGPELFAPKMSGSIIPQASRMNFSAAANNNQPQEIIVHVATDENFSASVQTIAGRVVVATAPRVASMAAGVAVRNLTRPRLMNGR
jgi:hypothetical protein